jgi:replicative DNA helicase
MADVHRLPVPSHSIEQEQALLGSLLIEPAAWSRISIEASDFYRHDHRLIFTAAAALHADRKPVDTTMVCDYLERQGLLADVGGLSYIGRLVKETATTANVESYAREVREHASLRRLSKVGERIQDLVADAGGRSAAELVANAQEDLHRLQTSARTGKGLVDARQLVNDFTDDLDARAAGSMGLQIGLPDFDEKTNGLEPGDLVVLPARPAMGKTALLISIASTVSETIGTAVFSAEMPSAQMMRRCVSQQTEIPQGSLRRPAKLTDEDWAKISTAAGVIAQRKLWIDDTGAPSLSHIRSETIALKARASLGLVMVDYVQLVRAPGANRYEQLRDVAYGLKALAKELAVPIIVLAQLNRDLEKRDDKRPFISDVRDSGAIEEAADIVGLLYSEGYYDPQFSMPYVLECSIAKNRNGERGQCLWHFDGAFSRVRPLDPGAAANYRRLLSKPQKRASSADL